MNCPGLLDVFGSIYVALVPRSRYGKERYAYRRDLAIQKLGFSTDNGAYYYYHTEENNTKTAEQTLVDVQVRKRAF
jgi:hypothetical protein